MVGGVPWLRRGRVSVNPGSVSAVAQHKVPEISALLVSPFVQCKGYYESNSPMIPQGNNVFHLERTAKLFIF